MSRLSRVAVALLSIFAIARAASAADNAAAPATSRAANAVPAAAQPAAVTGLQFIGDLTSKAFTDRGFPVQATDIAVINEGTKATITVDMTAVLASIHEQMEKRFADAGVRPNFELRVAGVATGESPVAQAAATPSPSVAWNDALERARRMPRPGGGLSPAAQGLADVRNHRNTAQLRTYALQLVAEHLEGMRESGLMYATIALDEYWERVLDTPELPDLYQLVRPDVRRAVNAGLGPYRRDGTLAASQFAELALNELQSSIKNPAH